MAPSHPGAARPSRRELLLGILGLAVLPALPRRRIWQVGIALPRAPGTLILRPADAESPGLLTPDPRMVISAWVRPIGGEWQRIEAPVSAETFAPGSPFFGADLDFAGLWGAQMERSRA